VKLESQSLNIQNLSFEREGRSILSRLALNLAASEIASLMGPSGSGKTTLLRLIAGFEKPSSGTIQLGDRLLCDVESGKDLFVPSEKRGVGIVFQDFALFPHLTVKENIVFGLFRSTKQETQHTLEFLVDLLGLEDLLLRFPHELSGGQQQRVAIGRALAPRPSLLLLDEPFSQLDPELREELIEGLGRVLRETRITTLLVTHHQEDAFDLSDKVGVLNSTHLEQWDTPFDLYHRPNSRFVADFVGKGVFIEARILGAGALETSFGTFQVSSAQMARCSSSSSSMCQLLVRPDDVIHDDAASFKARLIQKRFRGSLHLYTLELADGQKVLSYVPSHHNHRLGEEIGIRVEMDHVNIY